MITARNEWKFHYSMKMNFFFVIDKKKVRKLNDEKSVISIYFEQNNLKKLF